MRSWASLLLLVLVGVAGAQSSNPVVRMPNGLNWAPDGTATGDVKFVRLPPQIQDGVNGLWCSDCACGANNLCVQGTAGIDGAFAYRENGAWDCFCVTTGGAGCFQCTDLDDCNLCPAVAACMAPCVALGAACTETSDCCTGFCQGGQCVLPSCTGIGGGCSVNGDCCSGVCTTGSCASTSTTTTVTTTSTSMTTTTGGGGGGCSAVTVACSTGATCCSGICAEGICATKHCAWLDPMLPDDSNYEFDIAASDLGTTLLDATCYCQGTCDVDIIIDFLTRAGNQIDLAGSAPPDLLCQAPTDLSDSTWQPFDTMDADRILPDGRGLRVKANALSGGVDKVLWCYRSAP